MPHGNASFVHTTCVALIPLLRLSRFAQRPLESSLTCSSSGIGSCSPVCEFQYKCLPLFPLPGFFGPPFLL